MLEDFADFDLAGEESSRAREDRMRAAFENSKQSYSQEQVFTEPGWYDPPEIPPPTKLHIRNIDYSVNNLYLKREYTRALALALSQIEAEEKNSFGEGREFQLVDTAIRCALKIGDNELSGRLADKTVKKWSSSVGLASTSAEAYLASSRPRNALSAILTVISIRGPQTTYILVLYRALESLSEELRDSKALRSLLSIIKPYIHSRSSVDAQPFNLVDEATARTWLEECQITGIDQQRFLALLCHKSIETEGIEGRSVKTL